MWQNPFEFLAGNPSHTCCEIGFPSRMQPNFLLDACAVLICCDVVQPERMKPRNISSTLGSTLLLLAALSGCGHRDASPSSTPDAAAQTREQTRQQAQAAAKKIDDARQELEQIPPPAKSRYMAIHTKESWNNPFLVVSGVNVTLRVISPDQTHSAALPSAMLKPAKARRQELELRLSDLPDALSALPEQDWPYGRVLAVEEDPAETRANRLQVRQNVESTMQVLNNLGVVIYEWPTTGLPR